MPTWEEYWGKGGINDQKIKSGAPDAVKSSSSSSSSPSSSSPPSSSDYSAILMNARNNTNNSTPYSQGNNYGANYSSNASTPSAITQQAKPQTNQSGQTQLPSWMGNMYSQVPGTSYYSTNPNNPNASKYYADGSPVASVGFDFTQTGGTKFDGYASPEQFKQIMDLNNSGAMNTQGGQQTLASLLQGWQKAGQLTSNDSIYGNNGSKMYATSTAPGAGATGSGTLTALLQKDPRIDAMSTADQLAYYKANPQAAQQEILRAKQVYDGATTDAERNGAHTWADQLRQAAGISDSDTSYGNNNGVSPADQRNTLMNLLNGGSAGGNVGTPTGQGSSGASGTGLLNAGNGTGGSGGVGGGKVDPLNMYDRILSMFQDRLDATKQENKFARDQSLALLANQDNVINQNAVSDLNANDVTASKRMQMLKEAMASAGLSSSGDNISGQLTIGTDQQQGVNSINTNKTNKLADLMATRSAITNNATANDLAAMKQLWAERDGMLVNQSNKDRDFNYNAGRDAVKDSQWATETTGNYDQYAKEKQQMAANSAAWFNASPSEKLRLAAENQKIGASIGAKQDANGDWIMPQAQRTTAGRNADLNETQVMATLTGFMPDGKGGYTKTNAKQQQDLTNAWKATEEIGFVTPELSTLTGIPKGTPTQTAKNQAWQNAIAQQNADNNTSKTNWDIDPKNPDNIPKAVSETGLKATDISKMIDDSPYMIKRYNNDGKVIGTDVDPTKKNQLAQYIASFGLPANEAKQWFIRYGLWTGK
jgi:hypothetical protein